MNNNKDSKWDKLGYRLGQIFVTTLFACIMACLIAITAKLILLMF